MHMPTSVVNCFKQVLHPSVVIAHGHDIIGVSEVGHTDVGSNVNPWVTLRGSTKNPIDNIIDESRESSHPRPTLELISIQSTLNFDLVDS